MNLIIIVLSICLKSCVKNGNHGWVPSITSIAAAWTSNIGAAHPINLPVQCTEINYKIFISLPNPLESKNMSLLKARSLCHFKPAKARIVVLGRKLTVSIRHRLYILIILSTIKVLVVMKQNLCKKDEEKSRRTSRRNFDMDLQYI